MAESTTKQQVPPPSLVRSLATAERLREILRAETEALRAFNKERLLELVVQKEGAARELAQVMMGLEGKREKDSTAHDSLRKVLGDIVKCNQRNHIFVQSSLEYWQELLGLCFSGNYAFGHLGQPARTSMPVKGLALNREI